MIKIVKLRVKGGDTVTLITSGPDEQEARSVIGELLSQNST
jgi:phosphotransferase system HPr-like phosphotransfer protein